MGRRAAVHHAGRHIRSLRGGGVHVLQLQSPVTSLDFDAYFFTGMSNSFLSRQRLRCSPFQKREEKKRLRGRNTFVPLQQNMCCIFLCGFFIPRIHTHQAFYLVLHFKTPGWRVTSQEGYSKCLCHAHIVPLQHFAFPSLFCIVMFIFQRYQTRRGATLHKKGVQTNTPTIISGGQ